jgi:anti-sigma B factor antagonist
VAFMSSAMLGKLVTFNQQCKKKKIQLKVCGIAPDIMQVFKITKLNKVFEIVKNEEKAVASFNSKGWFG